VIPPSEFAPTAAAAESADRTLRCRMVADGASVAKVHFRTLPAAHIHDSIGVDEPDAAASELLLAILGTCLIERIRANAIIGNIQIASLVLEIEGDLPVSPLWGVGGPAPDPVGFEAIQVRVHVNTAAPEAALRALISQAAFWSPVANTLHGPVHLDVALGSAAPA
jgi:hypothetical protein